MFRQIVAFGALIGAGAPALAVTSVTIAGSFQSELGCPGDWQPDCGLSHMTKAADRNWYASFTLPAGDYEYKITYNDAWSQNYGANGVADGASIPLELASSGTVYFRYDEKTHLSDYQLTSFALGSTDFPFTATLAGTFQSELGCPGDWQPDCSATLMSKGADQNWYAQLAVPVGSYAYKIAYDGAWEENYGANGQAGGDPIVLDVNATDTMTYFRYDPRTHLTISQSNAFAIASVPEPRTWLMMATGFALSGGALRRARRRGTLPARAIRQ